MSVFPYTQKPHYDYSMRKFYLRGRKKGRKNEYGKRHRCKFGDRPEKLK